MLHRYVTACFKPLRLLFADGLPEFSNSGKSTWSSAHVERESVSDRCGISPGKTNKTKLLSEDQYCLLEITQSGA